MVAAVGSAGYNYHWKDGHIAAIGGVWDIIIAPRGVAHPPHYSGLGITRLSSLINMKNTATDDMYEEPQTLNNMMNITTDDMKKTAHHTNSIRLCAIVSILDYWQFKSKRSFIWNVSYVQSVSHSSWIRHTSVRSIQTHFAASAEEEGTKECYVWNWGTPVQSVAWFVN